MSRLVALDPAHHAALKVDTAKVEEQGADLHMIPVVVSEFLKLVVQSPILFSKNAETGQFVCVTLMGLDEGENLFWQGAQSDAIYQPLNIIRQPFFVGQDEQSGNNYVLCIDSDSASVNTQHGEPLFDQQGQATEYLQQQQDVMAQLLHGEQQTAAFIRTLLDLGLLVPLSLDISYENGDSNQIKGLYSIDEDKLAQLNDEQWLQLKRQGWMQAVYTQIASLGQIYALINRKNQRQATPSPWFQAAGA